MKTRTIKSPKYGIFEIQLVLKKEDAIKVRKEAELLYFGFNL